MYMKLIIIENQAKTLIKWHVYSVLLGRHYIIWPRAPTWPSGWCAVCLVAVAKGTVGEHDKWLVITRGLLGGWTYGHKLLNNVKHQLVTFAVYRGIVQYCRILWQATCRIILQYCMEWKPTSALILFLRSCWVGSIIICKLFYGVIENVACFVQIALCFWRLTSWLLRYCNIAELDGEEW